MAGRKACKEDQEEHGEALHHSAVGLLFEGRHGEDLPTLCQQEDMKGQQGQSET